MTPQISAQHETFDDLAAHYAPRLRQWCYRFTGDREACQDLAQDVLLRAFRNFQNFRGDSHVTTWLYVIARNHCANAMRKRHGEVTPLTTQLAAILPDRDAERVYQRIERAQAAKYRLRGVLRHLTRREAEVLWLHYGQETSLETITQTLGLINPSGAKAYIVSARRKLALRGGFSAHTTLHRNPA